MLDSVGVVCCQSFSWNGC